MARRPGERGSVALWVVIFAFAVLVLLTLVVDGGQLMNAKERAADMAGQAARAAVNDIDVTSLRSGQIVISPDACAPGGPAAAVVASYARGTGATATTSMCQTGTVLTPSGLQHFATVTVELTTRPVMPLGVFGGYQVPATRTAYLDCGVTQGVAC